MKHLHTGDSYLFLESRRLSLLRLDQTQAVFRLAKQKPLSVRKLLVWPGSLPTVSVGEFQSGVNPFRIHYAWRRLAHESRELGIYMQYFFRIVANLTFLNLTKSHCSQDLERQSDFWEGILSIRFNKQYLFHQTPKELAFPFFICISKLKLLGNFCQQLLLELLSKI